MMSSLTRIYGSDIRLRRKNTTIVKYLSNMVKNEKEFVIRTSHILLKNTLV